MEEIKRLSKIIPEVEDFFELPEESLGSLVQIRDRHKELIYVIIDKVPDSGKRKQAIRQIKNSFKNILAIYESIQ